MPQIRHRPRPLQRGAQVVYHAVGADHGHWAESLPPIMTGLIHAASSTRARLVYADNLYAYGPVDGPLTEALPVAAKGANGRLRAELANTLLDAHRSGKPQATIGRASDFFGPGVRLSTVAIASSGAVVEQLYQSELRSWSTTANLPAHLILHKLRTPKPSAAPWTGIDHCPRGAELAARVHHRTPRS
jgi:hypothetical protein